MFRARRSIVATITAGAAAAALVASVASGGPSAAGYNTAQEPMVTLLAAAPAKSSADAIISVGDTMPGGYTFESIPDGVSIYPRGNGRADVFVNHETSTVPFPFNSPWGGAPPNEANQNDFRNAEVSQLNFNQHSVGITHGSLAIASVENFQRFCSNYIATAVEGFKKPILFTNEEATDWVYRSGTAWPGPTFITPGADGAEQAGVVVAHDVKSGKSKPIYGMGRHNHENSVAVPGFDDVVLLSGDDTFSTTPASSQLYMYKAERSDDVWEDKGTLYALSAISTSENDYFDIQPGDAPEDVHFVAVPPNIATGKAADGSDLLAADVGYPAAPAGITDGPQWVLDQWGNKSVTPSLANDVFDFIRLEDVAYDKRPGKSNIVYIADTGRATSGPAAPLTKSTNGRIWKLELTPGDPTTGKLSVLVQGDDNPTAVENAALAKDEIHQPDNLETTANGNLLVTEDPSGNNQYSLPRDPLDTPARLWKVPLGAANPDASKVPLLEVNQALDENSNAALGAIDQDATTAPGRLGSWESSGIVDASAAFGPGAFFVTIQAHSYWVDKTTGPDILNAGNGQDYVIKKEAGQLLLLTLPGI